MAPGRKNRKKVSKEAAKRVEEQATPEAEMLDDNPEECQVCSINFDETKRRPRTLPCGHTFCSPCIANLMKGEGQITCPTCRAQHLAPNAAHFPVSYVTEAFIRRLRETKLTHASKLPLQVAKIDTAAKRLYQECAAGISKKLQSLLNEEKSSLSTFFSDYQQVQSQLDEYHTQVAQWRAHHQQLEESLMLLLEQNIHAKELLEQEDAQLLEMKKQGEQGEQEFPAVLEGLESTRTAEEADAAFDASDHWNEEAGSWISKCQEMFPNVKALTTSMKAWERIRAILNTDRYAMRPVAMGACAKAAPIPPGDCTCTLLQRAQTVIQGAAVIEPGDLHTMGKHTEWLVEAGLVFAKQTNSCSSRLTLQNDQLHLHSLLDQSPPSYAATVQVSKLVKQFPPWLVFLDLAWPGSPPRRVQIQLTLNTPRGKQFMLLCTGQWGASYAGSKLWKVGCKGKPGEYVSGGDYQQNNGEGGAALLPDLDKTTCWKIIDEGSVWGHWQEGPQGAQFAITTRNMEHGGEYGNIFGRVVSGLDVVREAACHSDITEVNVVDCGVVLWNGKICPTHANPKQ